MSKYCLQQENKNNIIIFILLFLLWLVCVCSAQNIASSSLSLSFSFTQSSGTVDWLEKTHFIPWKIIIITWKFSSGMCMPSMCVFENGRHRSCKSTRTTKQLTHHNRTGYYDKLTTRNLENTWNIFKIKSKYVNF